MVEARSLLCWQWPIGLMTLDHIVILLLERCPKNVMFQNAKREESCINLSGKGIFQLLEMNPAAAIIHANIKLMFQPLALAPMLVSPSTHASLSVNNHQLSVSNKHRPKKLDFTSWPSLPNDQTLTDWLAMRKRLKANVTQTVINRLGKKLHAACSAGYTVDDCISECVMRNWKGFDVEWMKKDKRKDRIQRDGFEHNDYNDGLEVFQ